MHWPSARGDVLISMTQARPQCSNIVGVTSSALTPFAVAVSQAALADFSASLTTLHVPLASTDRPRHKPLIVTHAHASWRCSSYS